MKEFCDFEIISFFPNLKKKKYYQAPSLSFSTLIIFISDFQANVLESYYFNVYLPGRQIQSSIQKQIFDQCLQFLNAEVFNASEQSANNNVYCLLWVFFL